MLPQRNQSAHVLVGGVDRLYAMRLLGYEVRNHENDGADAHDDGAHADPDGNVPPTAEVAHEDHRDHVAELVRRSYQPGKARWYFEALFNRCYHRVNVPRT